MPTLNRKSTTEKKVSADPSLYVFTQYYVANNQMKAEDPTLPTFQLTTTRGKGGDKKLTTLVLTTSDSRPITVEGVIDWRSKNITVGDASKAIEEVKHTIGETYSPDSEWTWPSGRYTITRHSKVWTAKRGGQLLATYTPLDIKPFSKNNLATLKFAEDMPKEEEVFLVLALMFRDIQVAPARLPRSDDDIAGEGLEYTLTKTAAVSCQYGCIVM